MRWVFDQNMNLEYTHWNRYPTNTFLCLSSTALGPLVTSQITTILGMQTNSWQFTESHDIKFRPILLIPVLCDCGFLHLRACGEMHGMHGDMAVTMTKRRWQENWLIIWKKNMPILVSESVVLWWSSDRRWRVGVDPSILESKVQKKRDGVFL